MKNKIFNQNEICKSHKIELEFICSCGDLICTSCIEGHKTHHDFVLKSKKNIFQELNDEIQELELKYEYISNSLRQEKNILKVLKELTKQFFRQELKNFKDKEILKILSDMKISLNKANLQYKYDYKFPDNFEIRNMNLMIEKGKRNYLKKFDKIQKLSDKILRTKNLFEAEFGKLLIKYFSLDNTKMEIEENFSHNEKPTNLSFENFEFTIGAKKNHKLPSEKAFSSYSQPEFVQSFYDPNLKNTEINKEIRQIKEVSNHFFEIRHNDIETMDLDKERTPINESQYAFDNIQIPIQISKALINSDVFDDKTSVGREKDNKSEVTVLKSPNSNSNNDYCFNKYSRICDETRPATTSNISRSPGRNKSPGNINRMNSIFDSDITMVCMNLNCRRSYKVKKGEEKWKKKCLTCYKDEKA